MMIKHLHLLVVLGISITSCTHKLEFTVLILPGSKFQPFTELVTKDTDVFRLPEIVPDPQFCEAASSDYSRHPLPAEILGEDRWRDLVLIRSVHDKSIDADHYLFGIKNVDGRTVLYSRTSSTGSYRGRTLVPHY